VRRLENRALGGNFQAAAQGQLVGRIPLGRQHDRHDLISRIELLGFTLQVHGAFFLSFAAYWTVYNTGPTRRALSSARDSRAERARQAARSSKRERSRYTCCNRRRAAVKSAS